LIYCSDESIKELLLKELTENKIAYRLTKNASILEIGGVRSEKDWEAGDVLKTVFKNAEVILPLLKSWSETKQIKVMIDVVFYHEERFPALVFEGENMKIIRELQADISIDPY
jgi:hypothetical protein